MCRYLCTRQSNARKHYVCKRVQLKQSIQTLLVVNILEILLFGILFQLMLYGCGGSVVAARNMKASSTMWSI